jgi:hypothetical protein
MHLHRQFFFREKKFRQYWKTLRIPRECAAPLRVHLAPRFAELPPREHSARNAALAPRQPDFADRFYFCRMFWKKRCQ